MRAAVPGPARGAAAGVQQNLHHPQRPGREGAARVQLPGPPVAPDQRPRHLEK